MTENQTDGITYEELRLSTPHDLHGGSQKRKLHIWQVLLFFVAVMILFYFLGGLAQYYLGMTGVLLCQIGFLVLSILFVVLMRADLREVFPIHRPKALGLLGVFICWIGVFLASEAISFLLLAFAADSTLEISDSINSLFSSGRSEIIASLIVSVAPAICEEALHRGVILSGFRNDLKQRKWWIVLFCGLIFGIFHMYPVRMIPTALIGCVLAYLMVTTNNMVYSSLLHLLHNGLLMVLQIVAGNFSSTSLVQDSVQMISSIPRGFFGIYVALFGTPAPILIYLGCFLVRRATAPVRPRFLAAGRERVTLIQIFFPTFAILAVGILMAVIL